MAELAAAPIVIGAITGGAAITRKIYQLKPQARLSKWDQRLAVAVQMFNENADKIRPEVLKAFFAEYDDLVAIRRDFEQRAAGGTAGFWELKKIGDEFAANARKLQRLAHTTSCTAMIEFQKCVLNHRNIPRNSIGKCAQCFGDSGGHDVPIGRPESS